MVKKIDQLIFRSFVPPFIAAYSIAMFVLLMQMLWLYIDDIAGKGLSPLLIMELLVYRSMSLIPLALPLGMLIASVMVMGNLAERYELSSIKSAGVSLWRSMRSILAMGIVVAIFSVYCSNTLIPISNLKFGSRMYDIQQKAPTLQMETGVFNYDFQGYAIHFKDKAKDGKTIKDVLIYDHSTNNTGEMLQIVAESGEMFTTPDGRMFVMRLKNGYQYMEQRPRSSRKQGKYPFVRVGFEEWEKRFDLSGFELERTNPQLFNRNRQMMNTTQLLTAIDSIGTKIDKRVAEVSNYVSGYFFYEGIDSTFIEVDKQSETYPPSDIPVDTSAQAVKVSQNTQEGGKAVLLKKKMKTSNRPSGGTPLKQDLSKSPAEWEHFVASFPAIEQRKLYNKAKTSMRSLLNQAESVDRQVDRMRLSRVKHTYDMHMKYGMAAICIIFVFIGAPMGAIIRKGGFGYPILISIIFFVLFVVMMMFCRKLGEKFVINPVYGAWIPCAIVLPAGIFLTYKAMRDSKMMNIDQIGRSLRSFFQRIFSKKAANAKPKTS